MFENYDKCAPMSLCSILIDANFLPTGTKMHSPMLDPSVKIKEAYPDLHDLRMRTHMNGNNNSKNN